MPRDRAAQPRLRHDRADRSRSRRWARSRSRSPARDEQQARWLPGLASGERLIAFALTEADAGSDPSGIRTRAVRDGDDYVIDGSKRFISHASVADYVVVFAVDEPRRREAEPAPVGDPRRDRPPGLQGHPHRAQDGHPRLAHGGARVRRAAGAGRRTGSATRARASRSRCRRSSAAGPGIAAQAVGIAQGALEVAARYANERRQFGKPIGELQMVQAMLADMDAQTEAARHLLYTACQEIEAGAPDAARWAAICKLVAGDTAMRVTTDAVQVLGGYGYIDEYPVERMMRDAKITQLYEGTQQIQRLLVARSLLARYA